MKSVYFLIFVVFSNAVFAQNTGIGITGGVSSVSNLLSNAYYALGSRSAHNRGCGGGSAYNYGSNGKGGRIIIYY